MSTANVRAQPPPAARRIPTFGSRIPIPGQSSAKITTTPDLAPPKLNEYGTGRRVLVGDKEGTLRYVGGVHFSEGTWCGVELDAASGKNDGVVRGVRYFACEDAFGLMVPLCKIKLSEQDDEDDEDDDEVGDANESGPHSILFGIENVEEKLERRLLVNNYPDIVNSTGEVSPVRKVRAVVSQEQAEDCRVINRTYSKLSLNFSDQKRCSSGGKTKKLIKNFEEIAKKVGCVQDLHQADGSARCRVRVDEDASKRDSLELEESLGILTPEQMVDVSAAFASRMPSSNDLEDIIAKNQSEEKPDMASPNLVDASLKDYSLGLLDENMLSSFAGGTGSESTMNLELLLDSTGDKSKDYGHGRLEQTPSPSEELPLDPTPVIEPNSKIKNGTGNGDTSVIVQTKNSNNSFVTSITSITSLDTGYQGDGEMSRPASRGPDHSPLTRRPLQRSLSRRPEPMTDSDFYTESDADNHEDQTSKGGRLARVIDGTLYGVDPQAAADIYVNNRENMDSSGIFTDIEGNTRADDLSSAAENEGRRRPSLTECDVATPSPSDTSTKTISNDSQNPSAIINATYIISEKNNNPSKTPQKDTAETSSKRKSFTPLSSASTPVSNRSPKHRSSEEPSLAPTASLAKKLTHKLSKRSSTSSSSANTAINSPTLNKKGTKSNDANNNGVIKESSPSVRSTPYAKKSAGRWDAVMDKISRGSSARNQTSNLKEIKSRLFSGGSYATPTSSAMRQQGSGGSSSKSSSVKMRRIRPRVEATPKGKDAHGSLNSSASDLSGASPAAKRISSSAKKRNGGGVATPAPEVVQVAHQVLAAAHHPKLSPRVAHKNLENKKNVSEKIVDTKVPASRTNNNNNNRTLFSGGNIVSANNTKNLSKQQLTPKDAGKVAVKGGRASPGVRPPQQNHLVHHQFVSAPKTVEALAVLVQHLVFNLDAFRTPSLKKELDLKRRELEDARISYRRLEDELKKTIEEERCRHDLELTEVNTRHAGEVEAISKAHETEQHQLVASQNEQILKLRDECKKLQRTHLQMVEILREENESIREEMDQKNVAIGQLQEWKKKHDDKMAVYRSEIEALNKTIAGLKAVEAVVPPEGVCKLEHVGELEGKESTVVAEVESLQAVLELKLQEVAELRRALAESNQKRDMVPKLMEKVSTLSARCEDLESQLESKAAYETELNCNIKKLNDVLKNEYHQNQRLTQMNEELQWKLKQNKDLLNSVIVKSEESEFNRCFLSASFSERHSATGAPCGNGGGGFERSMSMRERSAVLAGKASSVSPRLMKCEQPFDLDSSPNVKVLITKCDSISYLLDLDDGPDAKASKILRRSFRNASSSSAKMFPLNGGSGAKRPRPGKGGSPLSLSASVGAIVPSGGIESSPGRSRPQHLRSQSLSMRREDDVAEMETSGDAWPRSSSTPVRYVPAPTDEDEDMDEYSIEHLHLPDLPSEIGKNTGAQSLPVPKHLAGEAMIVSESNSEDESSTSSSSAQL